jgi:hypothetical protein
MLITRTRHRMAAATAAAAITLTGIPVAAHASTAPAPAQATVTTAGQGPCVTDFTDAPPTGSFYTAITWMACEGLTSGYADGSFGKNQRITRGETASFLYRLSGDKHRATTTQRFSDVPVGSTHSIAISWMQAQGLSNGYTDGTFGRNKPISRGELASFLYRYAKASGISYRAPARSPYSDMTGDQKRYYYAPAAWMKSTGLIGGYTDGSFRPDRMVTRGETAKFMYALETHLNGEPAPPTVTPKPVSTLPSADLKFGPYTGTPRRLQDIFHLECIHALDGEDLPEREDAKPAPGQKPVWSVHHQQKLTQGWKVCPTRMYEQIAIPAAFNVQAQAGDGSHISRLRITDGAGQVVGGFQDNVTGSAPARTELVEVLEIAELPTVPSTEGEIRYLRTLVVDTRSGPQLLIDQVSAPAQADPASLKAWDLAAGGDRRALVYASIRLDTPDDGRQMATSDLAEVLRSMVGSFVPAVM